MSASSFSDDDEDYVDTRSNGKATGRPSYESARPIVEQRQKLVRTNSGNHMEFLSIDGSTIHRLDKLGRESIPQKDDENGKPRPDLKRKPALDHMIQYIALKQAHDEIITAERAKAAEQRPRRNSVDFADAFRGAVADSDNLRLVMHDEHAAQGGHKTRDKLTRKEIDQAKNLLQQHLSPNPSPTPQSVFDQNRPKWHTPLPAVQNSGPPRTSGRTSKPPSRFNEIEEPQKRARTASPPPVTAPFAYTPGPGPAFTVGSDSGTGNKGRKRR